MRKIPLALILFSALGFQSFPEPVRYNLLLITLDTVRADRLGAYGFRAAQTPNLDRLAVSGTVFEKAFTHSPVTLPSHATLLTGRLPNEHGVRSNSLYRLTDAETTLAEILHDSGYRTAAFVGAAVLDHRFGLSQGFDVYDDEVSPQGPEELIAERKASEVAGKSAEWLRGLDSTAPFFLWVHFFDPHHPYTPPEPFRTSFVGSPYDGEIAYCDEAVGQVLAALDQTGRRKSTLVVVASDHGEALGEHGEATHGIFVYDSTLHVPLIWSGPGVGRGVRVEDGPVGLVDVLPTILARLGLDCPSGTTGTDLLSMELPDVVYAESYMPRDFYNWAELQAIRTQRFKYVEAPKPELYDLIADPKETRNLVEVEGETARELATRLSETTLIDREAGFRPEPELLSQLRSLGYVGDNLPAAESSRQRRERPDPKDKIQIVFDLDQAIGLFGTGRFRRAESKLEEILASDPHNFLALHYLGESRFELGPGHEKSAIEAYRRAIEVGRDAPYYRIHLAELHEKLGEYPSAVEEYGHAIHMNPEVAVKVFERGSELIVRKAYDEALLYLELLKDKGGGGPMIALATAEARRGKGEIRKALETTEEGLEDAPGDSRLQAARGRLLAELGRADEALSALEESLSGLSETEEKLLVLKTLAMLRGDKGELGEAVRTFEQALVLDPGNFECSANLALTLIRMGRTESALGPLALALEVRPDEVRLLNLKALIHFQRGELEESLALLRRSLKVDPNQPRIAEAAADVEAKLKKR